MKLRATGRIARYKPPRALGQLRIDGRFAKVELECEDCGHKMWSAHPSALPLFRTVQPSPPTPEDR